MKAGSEQRLAPTLWRTCRTLANKTRLKIFQALLLTPGLSVKQVASTLQMDMAVASKYLRELNARGLLLVRREAATVRYWPGADVSMPQTYCLVRALSTTFRKNREPCVHIFRMTTAFAHPRRIAIVREIAGRPAGSSAIRARVGISVAALRRHLRKLQDRGFVCRQPNGDYTVVSPVSVLGQTLLKLAVSGV